MGCDATTAFPPKRDELTPIFARGGLLVIVRQIACHPKWANLAITQIFLFENQAVINLKKIQHSEKNILDARTTGGSFESFSFNTSPEITLDASQKFNLITYLKYATMLSLC